MQIPCRLAFDEFQPLDGAGSGTYLLSKAIFYSRPSLAPRKITCRCPPLWRFFCQECARICQSLFDRRLRKSGSVSRPFFAASAGKSGTGFNRAQREAQSDSLVSAAAEGVNVAVEKPFRPSGSVATRQGTHLPVGLSEPEAPRIAHVRPRRVVRAKVDQRLCPPAERGPLGASWAKGWPRTGAHAALNFPRSVFRNRASAPFAFSSLRIAE